MKKITSKECRKCKEVKSVEDFYKKESSSDGYDYMCRDCMREYRRQKEKEGYKPEEKDSLNSTSTVWNEETVAAILEGLTEWLYEDDNNIFVGDYFASIGITTNKFTNESVNFPWLHEEYLKCREIQKYKLLNLGLAKRTDSALTRFVLTNMHDWREKQERDSSHSFEGIDLKGLVGFKDSEDE